MNIQDFKDAIKLTEYANHSANRMMNVTRYVYCLPAIGMLYEVDPTDGTILGQKYIPDIVFSPIPSQHDLLVQLSDDIGYEPDIETNHFSRSVSNSEDWEPGQSHPGSKCRKCLNNWDDCGCEE